MLTTYLQSRRNIILAANTNRTQWTLRIGRRSYPQESRVIIRVDVR
jgi:hypothetical protein